MTTASKGRVWVDQPYALIPLPPQRHTNKHMSVTMASEMCLSHNILIRGMNAIVLQAPHVHSPTDAKDFLFFVSAWVKMVHHHHWTEEEFLFPRLATLAGKPDFMADPLRQHEMFHDGLERLGAYCAATGAEGYRWDGEGGMGEIFEGFAGELRDHLHAEIEVLLGLTGLDHGELREIWDKVEKAAKQSGNIGMLYDVFPVVLGLNDKTYDGNENFPPLPSFIPYLIKYWFAAGNGAFRFCPSDFFGQPRPLAFIGAATE